MAEPPLHRLSDSELEAAVRGLAPAIAWPTAAPPPGGVDLAAAVRARIELVESTASAAHGPLARAPHAVEPARTKRPRLLGLGRWSWRPARRALVLAIIAVLAVAALVGAVGLGLPGLRLILGAPPILPPATAQPTPESSRDPGRSPAAGAPGASLGLGEALDPLDQAALDARAGYAVRAPAGPAFAPPDAVYIDDAKGGQLTMVWATRAGLPATLEPEVGLLLSQFRGAVEEGFFGKLIGASTTVERVQVAGRGGFWLSGDPHIFFWEGPDGFVDDPRRWVGDVLLWSDGPITYRLETSLGRDAAIRIAETMS